MLWALGLIDFVEWKTGEYVLEERNDQYWGRGPTIRQLKWTWTTEPMLMNMSVLAGAADVVNPLPPIFAEALSRNRKAIVIQGREARVFWIALNTKLKPLDDLRVRQALNYATDREALVAPSFEALGRRQILRWLPRILPTIRKPRAMLMIPSRPSGCWRRRATAMA